VHQGTQPTDVYVGRDLHVLGRDASGLWFRGRRALLDLETLRPYGKLSFGLSAAVVVLGAQVYNARLVAAMLAHGINRILTFNVADFSRYGVTAVHPVAVPGTTVPADRD